MRSIFYLILLGSLLLTAAFVTRSGILARKDPGRPINSAMREALNAEKPQLTADDEMVVAKTYGTAHRLPSGLRYVVRAPGTGDATPRIGDEVICNYDGRLLDGTSFDSSYRRGAPFSFPLCTGALIRGWDEAFFPMYKGEKRTLIIPYWLPDGGKGPPPKIPPPTRRKFPCRGWHLAPRPPRKMRLERRPQIALEPRDAKYIRRQTHPRSFTASGHADVGHLPAPKDMGARRPCFRRARPTALPF